MSIVTTQINTTDLAKEFAAQLKTYLNPAQMQVINDLNKTDEYIGLCATHDFCDPYHFMDNAFTKVAGREYDPVDDDWKVIMDAWSEAQINNFFID